MKRGKEVGWDERLGQDGMGSSPVAVVGVLDAHCNNVDVGHRPF